MFRNKPIEVMSIDDIKAKLKPILVDIRLLQRSCEMADYPWMRPEKFKELSLEQLQNKQRELIVQKRNLPTLKLSDSELNEVVEAAEKEAARQIETSDGQIDVNKIEIDIQIAAVEDEITRRGFGNRR